jgi:hypothetical protein
VLKSAAAGERRTTPGSAGARSGPAVSGNEGRRTPPERLPLPRLSLRFRERLFGTSIRSCRFPEGLRCLLGTALGLDGRRLRRRHRIADQWQSLRCQHGGLGDLLYATPMLPTGRSAGTLRARATAIAAASGSTSGQRLSTGPGCWDSTLTLTGSGGAAGNAASAPEPRTTSATSALLFPHGDGCPRGPSAGLRPGSGL